MHFCCTTKKNRAVPAGTLRRRIRQISPTFATVCLVLLMVLIVGAERLHAGGATDTGGRVTDPQGLAIPNARVALVHRGDSGIRETTTDEQGAFFFRAVPAGMYTLTAQAGAFKTVSKTLETTAAGANIV